MAYFSTVFVHFWSCQRENLHLEEGRSLLADPCADRLCQHYSITHDERLALYHNAKISSSCSFRSRLRHSLSTRVLCYNSSVLPQALNHSTRRTSRLRHPRLRLQSFILSSCLYTTSCASWKVILTHSRPIIRYSWETKACRQ